MAVATPGSFAATATARDRILLTWTDPAQDETGIQIQESTDGTNYSPIAVVGPDVESYEVKGLIHGQTYYYKARSFDDSGAPVYSDYTDVESAVPHAVAAVKTESALPTTGGATRPLPLLSHWAIEVPQSNPEVGWGANWQHDQIVAGKLFLPWIRLPNPLYWHNGQPSPDWTYQFQEILEYAAANGLPIGIKTYQPEAAFYTSGMPINFVGFAAADNPCAYISGARQNIADAIDPGTSWYDCGYMFWDNAIADWIQTLHPNPPRVILYNNNEGTKLTSFNIATSQRVIDAYPTVASYTTQQKIELVFDLYEARFNDMWDGMKARMSANWASVIEVVNYSPFNAGLGYFYGRYTYAPNYWGWRTGEQAAEHRRCDGFSQQWYNNHSSQALSHYDQVNSPQMHATWWPVQLDFIFSENAEFWLELATWYGNSQDISWSGMNPSGYQGMCLYGMWMIRPRVLREYQDATAKITGSVSGFSYGTFWDNVVAAIQRIHDNDTLRAFWQDSELLANGVETVPTLFANASALPVDAAFDTTDNWFKLTTSVDPGAYTADTTKVPVWAIARERGDTPNRQWLIYAFATDTDRTGVTVTVPVYGDIVINIPETGGYWVATEGGGYETLPAMDAKRPQVSAFPSGDHILVDWSPHSDNQSGVGVSTWTVERSANGLTGWSEIEADIPFGTTEYDDADANSSDTEYFYRVTAVGSFTSATSAIVSATTAAVPEDPTDIDAELSGIYVNVTWTLNGGETSVTLERGTDGISYAELAVLAAGTTSYLDSTVSPATEYWYQVKASNAIGDSNYSTMLAGITTPGGDLPDAPSNLTATPYAGGVLLEWTENEAVAIDTYEIERSTNSGLDWVSLVSDLTYGTDSYEDETATTAGAHYWYRIRVLHTDNNSVWSNIVSSPAGGGSPTDVPNPPRNLEFSLITASACTCAWADCSQVEVAYYLDVWSVEGSFHQRHVLPADTQVKELTGLAQNRAYRVEVRAVNAANQVSEPASGTFRTLSTGGSAPDAPTLFSLTGHTGALKATWTLNSSTESYVLIEWWRTSEPLTRARDRLPAGTESHTLTVDPVTGGPLVQNMSYSAHVGACNIEDSCSAFSNSGTASTPTDVGAPTDEIASPPTGFAASDITETSVLLSWADTNPDSMPTRMFKIERVLGDANTADGWQTIAEVGRTTLNFTSSPLSPGTTYSFRISADLLANPNVWSEFAGPIQVTTLSSQPVRPGAPVLFTPTEPSPGVVRLVWTWTPTQGAVVSGFSVYRSEVSETYGAALVTLGDPMVRTYEDDTVDPETTYYYVVRANGVGNAGQSTNSNEVEIETGADPGAEPDPPILDGLILLAPTIVQVDWSNTSATATGNKVKRSESEGGPYDVLATVDPLLGRYIDPTPAAETEYFYVVAATNAIGDSVDSNELSITTGETPSNPGSISLTARAIGRTAVSLSWAYLGGEGVGVDTNFSVRRGTDIGTLNEIADLGPGVLSYIDTELDPGTTYYYAIYPSASADDVSNIETVTTSPDSGPGGALQSQLVTYMRNVDKDTPDIAVFTASIDTIITDFYAFTDDATDGPFPVLYLDDTVFAAFSPYTGIARGEAIKVPAGTVVKIVTSGTGTGTGGYCMTVYLP